MYRIIFKQDECISFLYQPDMEEIKCPYCGERTGLCEHFKSSMDVDRHVPIKRVPSLVLLGKIDIKLSQMRIL